MKDEFPHAAYAVQVIIHGNARIISVYVKNYVK